MLAEAPPRAELPIVARALGARHASPFGLLNHIVGKPQALRERLGVRRICQQLLLARRRSKVADIKTAIESLLGTIQIHSYT